MKYSVMFALVQCLSAPTASSARNFPASIFFAVPSLDSLSDNQRFWLLIVILIVLMAMIPLAFVVAIRSFAKQMDVMARKAAEMGLPYKDEDAALLPGLSPRLYLLNIGHHRLALHVIRETSTAGNPVLFQYDYQIEIKNLPPVYAQTVAAFQFPEATLPAFHLGANHFWNQASLVPGFKTIAIKGHSEFSKRWLLRGLDENAALAFFTPSLLDYFAALPEKPEWTVEAADRCLLVYHWRKVMKVEEWRSFLDSAARMAADFSRLTGTTLS